MIVSSLIDRCLAGLQIERSLCVLLIWSRHGGDSSIRAVRAIVCTIKMSQWSDCWCDVGPVASFNTIGIDREIIWDDENEPVGIVDITSGEVTAPASCSLIQRSVTRVKTIRYDRGILSECHSGNRCKYDTKSRSDLLRRLERAVVVVVDTVLGY